MSVQSVTHENSRGWNRRVPRLLIALGLPTTLLIAVWSLPVVPEYPTIPEVVSWSDLLGYSLVSVATLAAVTAWYVPRICLWVCSSLALITASQSAETYVQIFGAVWLVIAAFDAAGVRRQVRFSEDWHVPHLGRGSLPLQHLADKSRHMSVIATILIVIAVAVFGWYLHERDELRALDDRAVTAIATVTGQDDFFDTVTMKVDGKKFDFLVYDVKKYPIGSKQEVFVDPTGEHRPYNREDVDPNGTMDLGAIPAFLLALAAAALILPRRRLARLRELADRGGDPARAVVVSDPHSRGLLVYPVGHTSLRHPIALIPRPKPVWGSGFAIPARNVIRFADPSIGGRNDPYGQLGFDPYAQYGREPYGGDSPPEPEPYGRDSSSKPEITAEEPELRPIDLWVLNPWDRSIFASPTEVFINGFRCDGSHVLVEHVDGRGAPHIWAASGPVRDPNTIRRLFARVTGRLPL